MILLTYQDLRVGTARVALIQRSIRGVELRGLEPLTPTLPVPFSAISDTCPDLGQKNDWPLDQCVCVAW
jgi:hypothetical protein